MSADARFELYRKDVRKKRHLPRTEAAVAYTRWPDVEARICIFKLEPTAMAAAFVREYLGPLWILRII